MGDRHNERRNNMEPQAGSTHWQNDGVWALSLEHTRHKRRRRWWWWHLCVVHTRGLWQAVWHFGHLQSCTLSTCYVRISPAQSWGYNTSRQEGQGVSANNGLVSHISGWLLARARSVGGCFGSRYPVVRAALTLRLRLSAFMSYPEHSLHGAIRVAARGLTGALSRRKRFLPSSLFLLPYSQHYSSQLPAARKDHSQIICAYTAPHKPPSSHPQRAYHRSRKPPCNLPPINCVHNSIYSHTHNQERAHLRGMKREEWVAPIPGRP